jgi:signal transduction histidine kinase
VKHKITCCIWALVLMMATPAMAAIAEVDVKLSLEAQPFNADSAANIYVAAELVGDNIADISERLEFILSESWRLRNYYPKRSIELGLYAIFLADSINDYYNLVKAHSFTGVSYRLRGDYNKAIEFFFRGLELAKQHKIPQQEGYAYINIANLHIYLEFYTQALENLSPALEIAQDIRDQDMLSYVYLNKGRVLMHLHEHEDAINDITRALEIRKKTGNLPGQAVCYKYLGDIYYNENKPEAATENYDLALKVVDKEVDKDLWGNLQLQKAMIYCRANNHQLAAPFAQRAYETGKELKSRLLIHGALKVLSRVHIKTGNPARAATLLVEMNQYADTLFSQQLAEKMLGMEFTLSQQKQQGELDLIKKDKEIQHIRLSRQRYINILLWVFSLLMVGAGVILLILIKKLQLKNNQLLFQKEELNHSNVSKDRMFMVIGHDLRNPIWNLRALIELLKDDKTILSHPGLADKIGSLSRAVQSVSDLLENLLYWAKSQEGKIIYNPAPTDLRYLVLKSIQPYRTWAENKGVNIDIHAEDVACMVKADENMIQAVIRNLVSNAIKYSYSDSRVEISIKKNGENARFSVKDFGRGVNPEELLKIKNGTVLPSGKGTGDEPGAGIGLSLCKDFITRHKSKLLVDSIPGTGTMFYFDLPVIPRTW